MLNGQLDWVNVFLFKTSSNATRKNPGQENCSQVNDSGQREEEIVELIHLVKTDEVLEG